MIPKILTVTDIKNTVSTIEQFAKQNAISPSHRIIVEPEKEELTVDQIHQMQQDIRVEFDSPILVVLVGVDVSSSEVQNSLLKCLEEDAGRILFLFLVKNPQRLLPTILSRCSLLDSTEVATPHNVIDTSQTEYFSFEMNSDATKETAIARIDDFLQSPANKEMKVLNHVLSIRKLIIDNNMNPTLALDSILLFLVKNSTIKVPQP